MIELIEPVDLQDRAEIHGTTVLVEYNKTEAGLAALREDLKGKTYDLATTKGNEAARADRLRCVTLRTTLEKTRKAFKAPALAYGKKIDAEAERITAEIEALEKPIDAQIRADEARREAEKEAKRQAEAARVQAHEANIARIHAFLPACNGKDSTRLARGMELLGEFEPDGTWEEFEDRGKQAKAETLAAMKVIYDRTKAAEDAAAALEAQRQEQERVAAELAEQQAEINRQRAELERQQREIIEAAEAEKRAAAAKDVSMAAAIGGVLALSDRLPGGVMQALDAIAMERAQAAASQQPDTTAAAPIGTGETPAPSQRETPLSGLRPDGSPKPVITIELEDAPPPPFAEPAPIPTLKLGEIQARLGFDGEPLKVTGEFLSRLGFEATRIKSASLYQEADFARICAALINHLGRLA